MTTLKWEKARLFRKRSISIIDEKERLNQDAAERWLARKAKVTAQAKKRRPRR
jgi:hypothetical protein